MTQHSQNGEGVEVIHDSANSHCFDDRIMVAGECIAFASEPWSSKIAASLTAREPATADAVRDAAVVVRDLLAAIPRSDRKGSLAEACARAGGYLVDLAALSHAAPSSGHAMAEGERLALLTKALQRIQDEPLHTLPIVTTQRMRNIAGFALLGEDLA